jgi:hypothetical protein
MNTSAVKGAGKFFLEDIECDYDDGIISTSHTRDPSRVGIIVLCFYDSKHVNHRICTSE